MGRTGSHRSAPLGVSVRSGVGVLLAVAGIGLLAGAELHLQDQRLGTQGLLLLGFGSVLFVAALATTVDRTTERARGNNLGPRRLPLLVAAGSAGATWMATGNDVFTLGAVTALVVAAGATGHQA